MRPDTSSVSKTGLVWNCCNIGRAVSIIKLLREYSVEFHVLLDISDCRCCFCDADEYIQLIDYYIESFEPSELPKLPMHHLRSIVPEFNIISEFNFGWDGKWCLVNNINTSALFVLASLLNSNNASMIFLSGAPDMDWLGAFLKSEAALGSMNGFSIQTLEEWSYFENNFKFSFFNMLPDWDCDSNSLLISRDQKLRSVLMEDENWKSEWRVADIGMFPTNLEE
jgi:hypothetical protein